MELTKYGHACFTLEKDGQLLVIDPGSFSSDFIAPDGIVGIIITHQHTDHFDHDQITAIIDKNPDAIIFAHPEVTKSIEVFQTKSVLPGDKVSAGLFDLEFIGGEHAVIHATIPSVANLGVIINDLVYYPGDSLVRPERPIDTLAVPAAAPWLKIGDAMDFLVDIKPRLAFPTHDAILSPIGLGMVDRILGTIAAEHDIEYRRVTNHERI